MQKIAATDLNHLLVKSAHVIRTQESQISDLKQRLSDRDRSNHAVKIAGLAVERGVMSEDNADEYARSLADSDKDLDMVEDFVSRNNGAGLSLGSELSKTASDAYLDDGESAEGRFNNFLLTSDLA